MLLAPTFFRDSQSSYGLWAGMANPGTVHAIPLLAWIQQPGVTTDDTQPGARLGVVRSTGTVPRRSTETEPHA